jgi:transcriptional regulator of heat shock response
MTGNESVLKKEFRERDVQRIRNIVNKKYGDKTTTQVGYTKEFIDHKEGDVWEENGKQWTIKNGIKMTISKLDLVKKSLQIPLTCPNCGKAMKKKNLDSKMYSIHKQCFDCVIKMETKLRLEGKYEDYVKNMVQRNASSYVNDLEQILEDMINDTTSEHIVNENGETEVWSGGDDKTMVQEFKEYIEKVKNITQF